MNPINFFKSNPPTYERKYIRWYRLCMLTILTCCVSAAILITFDIHYFYTIKQEWLIATKNNTEIEQVLCKHEQEKKMVESIKKQFDLLQTQSQTAHHYHRVLESLIKNQGPEIIKSITIHSNNVEIVIEKVSRITINSIVEKISRIPHLRDVLCMQIYQGSQDSSDFTMQIRAKIQEINHE